jgi:DNA-binding GntR family transcriptional regulator
MPIPLPTTTLETAPGGRTTLLRRRLRKDEVFDRLFAAILDGTLRPGERLRDPELQRWFDVSRTPIRLALERLGEMRLVEITPNRSTRVSPAAPGRIPQTVEAMCGLWALAARLSIGRLDDREREECAAGLRRAASACRDFGIGDPARAVERMREALYFFSLHAENELLQRMVVKIGADLRFQLALPAAGVDISAFAGVFDDLVEAVEAGDVERAELVFAGLRHQIGLHHGEDPGRRMGVAS